MKTLEFTVERRHHNKNKASLWSYIQEAADFPDYSATQIKGMLRQLNEQAKQIDLSSECVWQPVITIPPRKASAVSMIGTNPSGKAQGT
jgi:hypothetical protein